MTKHFILTVCLLVSNFKKNYGVLHISEEVKLYSSMQKPTSLDNKTKYQTDLLKFSHS